MPYLSSIIEEHSPDFIALQETWLYAFQNDVLSKAPISQYNYVAKSVDDDDPLLPVKLPRGYGGVCILWKKDLTNVKTTNEGSNRMCVISVGNTTIINVYMPCRGKYTTQDFEEELDQLSELVVKYQETHIILTGDMNVDISADSARAKSLLRLMSDNALTEPGEFTGPTFIHHNGRHSSRIDYIFVNNNWDSKKTIEYKPLQDEALNTSTHCPLILKTSLKLDTSQKEIKPKKKLNWRKADTEGYTKAVGDALDDPQILTHSNPEDALQFLMKTLTIASDLCVPSSSSIPKQSPWNKDIANLLKSCRDVNKAWKQAGKPPHPHRLFISRKSFRKQLRQAQRLENTARRMSTYNSIMAAHSVDLRTFYRLVNQQRGTSASITNELVYDGTTFTENLIEAWMLHFSNLAKPRSMPQFNSALLTSNEIAVENLKSSLLSDVLPLTIPITATEVAMAISSLKKNKAKDEFDITAEHLQHASSSIAAFITPTVNEIFNTGVIPQCLKSGIIHPIHKKGKETNNPANYRGITITPLLSKVIDKILLAHQRTVVPSTHALQYGFTEGRSCLSAALILSECLSECADLKKPLFAAVLDVQKAFDVINHATLLHKYHSNGLNGNWWMLKESALNGMTARVSYGGELSEEFLISQGSRQGGISSPEDYKIYQLDLLNSISEQRIGLHIGSIPVPTPTCADDMLLLADNFTDLQLLLDMTSSYANDERYIIHPEKTVIAPFNISPEFFSYIKDAQPFMLDSTAMCVEQTFTHLGIKRSVNKRTSNMDPSVAERLGVARRTAYSLMGAGLHGCNGQPPLISLHMYNIYIIPRFTYGLEVLCLSAVDIKALEKQHRSFIKSILHLPKNTANCALNILTGTLPVEGIIDSKIFKFLHQALSQEGVLRDIILRQHACKQQSSHSWVVYVEEKLRKYSLPNIINIDNFTKDKWKKLVTCQISVHWKEKLGLEAEDKSSVKYLNPLFVMGTPHLALSKIDNSIACRRATIKCKLLTGTLMLQSLRVTYKQAYSANCLLCSNGDETVTHFLLKCHALATERGRFLPTFKNCVNFTQINKPLLDTNEETLVQLLIDPTSESISSLFDLQTSTLDKMEDISRKLCASLYNKRLAAVSQLKP